jgi:hypothetical protein
MNCAKIQAKLLEYLTGELKGNLIRSMEDHLKTCPACQKELMGLKKTFWLFNQLPSVELPPEQAEKFLLEVRQKIRPQIRPKRIALRHQWNWLLPRLVPALTVGLILIFFGLWKLKPTDKKYAELATDVFTSPYRSLSSEFIYDYFVTNGTLDLDLLSNIENYLNSQQEIPDLVEDLNNDERTELVQKIKEML